MSLAYFVCEASAQRVKGRKGASYVGRGTFLVLGALVLGPKSLNALQSGFAAGLMLLLLAIAVITGSLKEQAQNGTSHNKLSKRATIFIYACILLLVFCFLFRDHLLWVPP